MLDLNIDYVFLLLNPDTYTPGYHQGTAERLKRTIDYEPAELIDYDGENDV